RAPEGDREARGGAGACAVPARFDSDAAAFVAAAAAFVAAAAARAVAADLVAGCRAERATGREAHQPCVRADLVRGRRAGGSRAPVCEQARDAEPARGRQGGEVRRGEDAREHRGSTFADREARASVSTGQGAVGRLPTDPPRKENESKATIRRARRNGDAFA